MWEAVKRAPTVSADELEASRRKWQGVLGLLDDCLEELKEMEESTEEEEDEEDSEEEEEEDEFRSSHPLSATERARVSAAHLLLRVGRLLVLRLLTSTKPDTLSTLPSTWQSPAFLTRLTALAKELSSAADDAAVTLEPPQVGEDVANLLAEFAGVARRLSDEVEKVVEEGEGMEAEAEWLERWREQLATAEEKLKAVEAEEEA